ncbi:hypothetical protein GQ54DRAFT_318173 [Martensiomyces pterosporus]|nr:hypothetical protein GQ54DRAFT_318173 [Martensiomyces pterosporus]
MSTKGPRYDSESALTGGNRGSCENEPVAGASAETDMPLVELLQAYPGLLSDKVEVVARALTQATMAARDTATLHGAGKAASTSQRIRWGKSMAASISTTQNDMAGYYAGSVHSEHGAGSGVCGNAGARASQRWLTQEHLQRLQQEGVVFTKGKFTEEENIAIDGTIAGFIEAHGITRQELYDDLFRRRPRDTPGRQLRKSFWPIMAEALPARQIQAIYHHVRRKYHPHNYQGAWTPNEDDELRKLVATHGPAWEAISEQLGRMGTNCRDRWRYIQGGARSQQGTSSRKDGSSSSGTAAAQSGARHAVRGGVSAARIGAAAAAAVVVL